MSGGVTRLGRQNAPEVLASAGDWMGRAVCGGVLYWCELPEDTQLADCASCPVATACLAHAITTRAVDVVQGGVVIGRTPIRHATLEAP
nr:MAG TPA: Transcriptional regulator WhiB1 [Caudoviricetes sp.]